MIVRVAVSNEKINRICSLFTLPYTSDQYHDSASFNICTKSAAEICSVISLRAME